MFGKTSERKIRKENDGYQYFNDNTAAVYGNRGRLGTGILFKERDEQKAAARIDGLCRRRYGGGVRLEPDNTRYGAVGAYGEAVIFAGGAMLYVVVEELIPGMSEGEHSNIGTMFFTVGFSLMMVLDVALG